VKIVHWISAVLALGGVVGLITESAMGSENVVRTWTYVAVAMMGVALLVPQLLREFRFEAWKVQVAEVYFGKGWVTTPGTKGVDRHERERRQRYAGEREIPGAGAAEFNSVAASVPFRCRPGADPMVPMYVLDSSFRIIDWNEALSLAFDGTIEGCHGQSALEWVYYFDNFEEVVDHGTRVFGSGAELPEFDIEPIEFTSEKYGKLNAKKRAFRVPGDDGGIIGWLITLEVEFVDRAAGMRYRGNVIRRVRQSLLWSEYSISYDAVLTASQSYPRLVETLLAEHPGVGGIAEDATVLDLGCGTGNVALRLCEGGAERRVVAVDNNWTMLETLLVKCAPHVSDSMDHPGVVVVKQDANTLHGFPREFFDCAILNNVLYSLESPEECLRGCHRVLKTGGQIRLSGPKSDTRVGRLMAQLRRELEASGRFAELEADFERVRVINEYYLAPQLRRWSVGQVRSMLEEVGFSVDYSTDHAYSGEGMILMARKV
jgi:ubiquinone/menaquinone biosynthesis C-methylase UbiE